MSLKAFHIVFITISIVMCVGLGVWGLRVPHEVGATIPSAMGVIGFVGAVVLALYGVWFLKKIKRLNHV